MLGHKIITTSSGTSVKVKWPDKKDFEWLARDGQKRLFSARDGQSSEERAMRFLIGEYEKMFAKNPDLMSSGQKLGVKDADPLKLITETFGPDDTIYVRGGREVVKKTKRKKTYERSFNY